ncbi:MAG: OmpA family protein [Myxococcales bacterium]|nr:OmpA family protein [Myxococcales bacterium]
MSSVRLIIVAALLSLFFGCASTSSNGLLNCVPILCTFLGEAPAPAPPPVLALAPAPAPAPPQQERFVLRGVKFAFDSDEIDPASAVVLDVVAETLNSRPNVRVLVEGHTDSRGDAAYNQTLSQRRAESVQRHLIGRGVPASRMQARGFGEFQPEAGNDTDEGRALNRRVELSISN